MSNSAGDLTNDIDIATGTVTSDDAALVDRRAMTLTAITKQLDAAWAVGTGAGGRDTGSIANTTYHVWVIMRPDTSVVDVLFSTSATSPTMPTNYTKKRRIGAIIREAAAIVTFIQDGNFFQRTAVLDIDVTNPGTSAVTRTLSVPIGSAVMAHMNVLVQAHNANEHELFSDLAIADVAASASVAPLASGGNNTVASGNITSTISIRTNTSGQIRTRASASGGTNHVLKIATTGWSDTRGVTS